MTRKCDCCGATKNLKGILRDEDLSHGSVCKTCAPEWLAAEDQQLQWDETDYYWSLKK